MPCEDTEFRQAMRLLAGGVAIIATAHNGQRSGLTATAVCSLAISPARILTCINLKGYTFELLSRSRCMSVNVLAEDHQCVADRFAGKLKMEDCDQRFVGSDWRAHVTGAPLLADALVALDCTISQMTILDTHAIVIGLVERATFGAVRPPLLHFDGGFMPRSCPLTAVSA
jgi:flavin reductase (DIM6/NTAB) family NADH-FMN oxidoreductase RutF